DAAALYRESLATRRDLPGDQAVGIAITTSNLAVVLHRLGDVGGAVRFADSALALFNASLGPDHQRTITVLSNLAAFESMSGDHRTGASRHRQLLVQGLRLFGDRHPAVAHSMASLANELRFIREFDEAERLAREALRLRIELFGESHEDVGISRRVLGDILLSTRRAEAALEQYESAYAILQAAFGPAHREVSLLRERIALARQRAVPRP